MKYGALYIILSAPKGRQMSRKPSCFGDSDEYTPTSSICKKCPFRHDCRDEVDSQVNKAAATYGTFYSSGSNKTKKTNGQIQPLSAGKALMSVGMSPYNHAKPLAPQFFRYLGFSVAKTTLIEGIQLIDSARDHYAQENIREIEALVSVTGEKNDDD